MLVTPQQRKEMALFIGKKIPKSSIGRLDVSKSISTYFLPAPAIGAGNG